MSVDPNARSFHLDREVSGPAIPVLLILFTDTEIGKSKA